MKESFKFDLENNFRMTKVTVTIDNKSNTLLFLEMLNNLKFVKKVEAEKGYDELSSDEIRLLEDRWTDYLKNPKSVQTWDEVKTELTKKHAR